MALDAVARDIIIDETARIDDDHDDDNQSIAPHITNPTLLKLLGLESGAADLIGGRLPTSPRACIRRVEARSLASRAAFAAGAPARDSRPVIAFTKESTTSAMLSAIGKKQKEAAGERMP